MHFEILWRGDPNLSARPHTRMRAPRGNRMMRTRDEAERAVERWLERMPADVARAVREQHAPQVVAVHLGVVVREDVRCARCLEPMPEAASDAAWLGERAPWRCEFCALIDERETTNAQEE